MPIASVYIFEGQHRSAVQFSHCDLVGGLTTLLKLERASPGLVALAIRPDDEVSIDLYAIANRPDILDALDRRLGTSIERRGPVYVGLSMRIDESAGVGSLLGADAHFWTKFAAPGAASGATASCTVTFARALDGQLTADVIGSSVLTDPGVRAPSRVLLLDAGALIPALVTRALARYLSSIRESRFEQVYLLPGNAERSGVGTAIVTEQCTLCLVPGR